MALPADIEKILEEEEASSAQQRRRTQRETSSPSPRKRRPQQDTPAAARVRRPQQDTPAARARRPQLDTTAAGQSRRTQRETAHSGTAGNSRRAEPARTHSRTQAEQKKRSHSRPQTKRKLRSSIAIFPAVILYNELLLKLFAGTGIFRNFFYILFMSAAVGLFFAALTSLFRKKTNRLLTKILLAVNAVFFTAESLIRSVYLTYMSFKNLLSGAGNVATKYSGELIRSIIFGLPKIILFLLPVVLYFLYGKRFFSVKRAGLKMSGILAGAALILFIFVTTVAGHGKNAAIYGAQFDFNRATETFGLSLSQRQSFHYGIFGNKNSTFHAEEEPEETDSSDAAAAEETEPQNAGGTAGQEQAANATPTPVRESGPNIMDIDFSNAENSSDEEVRALTEYVKSVTPSSKNAWTGLFKGKNLIMVCAESYCGSFISEELTPTLWRLTHNGIYFPEYYQPEWGGSTTTGEVAYLIGMAARYGDDSMIRTRENNNYFTIANQLQRLGYSSCAFHNGDDGYYERNTTHENLGYDQFVANRSGIEDLCGSIYPYDTTMFENTVDLYLDKQPFNIYYMTLSGHAKYTGDDPLVSRYYDRVNAAVGDRYEEKTKYYICYQMELEESMKYLVEKLEAAGIADDTVIVMVGDHYPYGLGTGEAWGNDHSYIPNLMGHDVNTNYDRDRNNLVIWSGCLEHADKDKAVEVSEPVFCLDIVPTLSNLFGLEYDSRLLPGRDVFGGTKPLVFWNTLSWVTDKGKYDSNEEVFHPRDGVEVDENYVERINKQVQNKILQSRVTLDDDYFRLLFGKDEVTHAGQKIYVPEES